MMALSKAQPGRRAALFVLHRLDALSEAHDNHQPSMSA
jgi:hypothetical protein